MTLAALLTPFGLAALFIWEVGVLSAAQLTIRLILAFSVRVTLLGALALSAAALLIAAMYDLLIGPNPGYPARLHFIPVPMLLMALAGYATARWILGLQRQRGQVVAALMIGLLAPHLFTLAPT